MENIFKINDRIKIQKLDDNNVFNTKIEGIDKYLYLSIPSLNNFPLIPLRDEKLLCGILFQKIMYKFNVNFINIEKDNIPLLKTTLPYNIEKIQLRDFVRISDNLKIIAVYHEDDIHKEFITFSNDISGNGINIIINDDIENGKYIDVFIDLFNINIKCKIVRKDFNNYGLKFINIKENERQKIIKYIFKKQINKIK